MTESRKLQIAGGSSYVVSLPKPWVLRAGLKAGDTIFLDAQGDGSISLRYRASEKPALRRKSFEVHADEEREHLLRKLVGSYVSGFSIIEVRFPPDHGPFVRRTAREFCRSVVGPEVVEEQRNTLVIQDVSDPSDLSSEKCLRRMHLIVRSMLEDSVQSLKLAQESLAEDVIQRDQDVDRLFWMISKQYRSSLTPTLTGNGDLASAHIPFLVGKSLERIGDHAQRIAGTLPVIARGKGLDSKIAKEMDLACASSIGLLDKAFSSLVTRNIDQANETIDGLDSNQKVINNLSNLVATRKGEELLALGTVVDSLGRAAAYASEIAEQAIDLAIVLDGRES
jgi:phosphate uptake regulator